MGIRAFSKSRITSIILGLIAYLATPTMIVLGAFDPPETDQYFCGLYILVPMAVAGLAMLIFSGSGSCFGIYSYKKESLATKWKRLIEIFAISLPALATLGVFASIVISDYLA